MSNCHHHNMYRVLMSRAFQTWVEELSCFCIQRLCCDGINSSNTKCWVMTLEEKVF